MQNYIKNQNLKNQKIEKINKNIQFKGMFPTSLGAIDFTTQDTEVAAITVSASFSIRDYTIESVT